MAAGLDGNWNFDLDTPTGSRKGPVELRVEGDKVSGKWAKFDIKGTYTDGAADLAFPYTSEEGIEGTLKVKVKLDGDTLSGTWALNEYNGSLKAVRAAGAATGDVAGKWKFILETPGGQRDIDADFTQQGSQLGGKWGNGDAKGTCQNGQFELSANIDSPEAGAGTFKAKGKLDNGALTGTWDFKEYNGTFKATRP
jgi:hypothetical protein